MSVQRRAACRQRSSRRSAAVCMPASRRSSRSVSSARCGWPCSSAISASSIKRGDRQARRLRVRPAEHRLGRVEIANVDRGARSDDRIESAGTRYRQRFQCALLGLAVTPFEQRDEGGVLRRTSPLQLLAPAPGAHRLRKARGAHGQPDRAIQRGEADDGDQQQQVERKLDPVRRRDQQRVPRIQLDRQRGGHRRRGEQQEPEEKAHWRPVWC